MNLFYISNDLRDSNIYIAPYNQEKENAYLIQTKHMGEAQNLLKKLNGKLLEGPLKSPAKYEFNRTEILPIGEVKIYTPKA